MEIKLINLPDRRVIKAGTIIFYSPTGEVIFFENLRDYLDYLDQLENNDID